MGFKIPTNAESQCVKLRSKCINGIKGTTGAQTMIFNKYNW